MIGYEVEWSLNSSGGGSGSESNGASVAHLSERAPFTSANVGSIPVGNDL